MTPGENQMTDEQTVDLVVKTGWALARYITELETVNTVKTHQPELVDAWMEVWKQIYEAYLTNGESRTDKSI